MSNRIQVLWGQPVADAILTEVKEITDSLKKQREPLPRLGIMQIGDNPASNVYVKKKMEIAQSVGIATDLYKYDDHVPLSHLLDKIGDLNADNRVSGMFLQLPITNRIPAHLLTSSINPSKDVDGLTPKNVGALHLDGRQSLMPCTAKGIITLLDFYNIPIESQNIVIVGRSNLVGKPLQAMLTDRNATVTLCHSKTKNLRLHTSQADIVIYAIGKAKFFDSTYVGHNQTIIDVGINRDENGKLCGDVDFDEVVSFAEKEGRALNITPVPKGVGVLTTATLMANVINTYYCGEEIL